MRPIDGETVRLLTAKCASAGTCRIYYDLAPSGSVHQGILRTLLYAQQLSVELRDAGIRCELTIRINDRAPVRGGPSADERHADIGRRWRDCSDPHSGRSWPELFREEIEAILAALNFKARVLDASAIYTDAAFQDFAWSITARHRFFPGMDGVVHPVSAETGRRILWSDVFWSDDRLMARDPDQPSPVFVSRDFGGGLIGYRLETALMWRHFGFDLDLHAANQSFNYRGSVQISQTLFGSHAVSPRLGIVLGEDGKMMSKSRCNFVPVVDTLRDDGAFDALAAGLSAQKWWRDLRRDWHTAGQAAATSSRK